MAPARIVNDRSGLAPMLTELPPQTERNYTGQVASHNPQVRIEAPNSLVNRALGTDANTPVVRWLLPWTAARPCVAAGVAAGGAASIAAARRIK
jgi:hypothetical protein